VVELIHTLALPVVAGIALVCFREPLGKLLAELPHRASKTTVFDFSIEFLKRIQKATPPTVSPAKEPVQEAGWIDLESSPPVREYAEWLNPHRLNALLADVISTSSFEDSPDLPNSKRVESILRRTGAFVALVDHQGFFEALVNRQILLETAAASALRPKTQDDN
jgi:hypothetical protein